MIAQLQKHVRLWFLTAIALLAAVPPAIARDFTYEYAGQTLTYTVLSEEDKTCETKQGNAAIGGEPVSGTVVIPETVSDGSNSYTVTTIGSSSFYRTHDSTSILTTVELPSSVTTIGELAFANCTGLKSIKITSSLTTIGKYAFCDCSALTSIELPSSLTTIGNSVFEGCSSLTTIEIPNSVTMIDEYAFLRCTGLTSIEFPSSVTTIGQSAFAECTSLTSVEIPSSVTTIGGGVFSGCANLTSAVYNSDADAPLLFRDCPISDLTIGGAIVPYLGVKESLKRLTLTDRVTTIGERAFQGCTGLTSVELPGSVTTIGPSAFYGCTGLTSVELPGSVTTIGPRAFYGCTGLTSIEIPSSVNIIARSTFFACTGLTSIELPGYVTTVDYAAFYGCTGLTSIKLPNSVTTIGEFAFENTGLTSIEIPSSVTTIGEMAFHSCTNLTSVIYNSDAVAPDILLNSPISDLTFGGTAIPDNMAEISGIKGSLKWLSLTDKVTTIGNNAFNSCVSLTSVELPSSVTVIGVNAFASCPNLTSVIYNSDAYADGMFNGCSVSDLTFGGKAVPDYMAEISGIKGSLKRLTLTDRVTTIGERAFENCTGLTSVELPNSLISIGLRAFFSCTGLTSVAIPNSVTTIGDSAFSNCTGLTSVNLPKSLISIGFRAFDSCIGLTSVEIPNSVTTIGEGAFWECTGLTSIEIPSSVITIGNSVFLSCTNLTSVIYNSNAYGLDLFLDCPVSDLTFGCTTVPDNIAYRFNIRGSLKRLALTDKVITIGDDAFNSCSGLTSIEIPGSVTTIGYGAFAGCSNLTSVIYNSDAYAYSIFSNSPVSDLTLGGTSVPDYMAHTIGVQESLERLTLTDNVKTIGKCAFQFTRLISVELPSSITTIGDNAFDACSGLTSIELPGSVITIGKGAFAGCTGLTSIEIPSSVTTIGNSAFESCTGLTSVEIPNSLTTIGSHVFNDCKSLTSVAIPSSVTTIGMVAFGNCTGLTSVELPSSVTTIGDGAFYGCSGLTSIAIPSSVTTIEGQAFEDCTGLTSVIIPGSVATIGKFAFSCCTGLTSIEIPNSVTAIEYNVFSGCSNLTSVIYNSDAYAEGLFHNCQVTDVTFGGTTVPNKVADTLFSYYNKNSLKNITFTDNVSSIGEQAFAGCGNIEKITFASVTPPEANQNEFSELWRSARIVIPGDALTTYLDSAPYNRFYKWGTVEEPEGHSDGVFAYVFTENPPAAYLMADESYREAGPALTVPLRTNKGTTIYPIKGILPGAFHYCTNLSSAKIGDNVELIGYNAFASCNALTSVEIPNSVITGEVLLMVAADLLR